MLWGTSKHPDLSERISHWQEEVFTRTIQQGSTRKPRAQKHEPYHMKLRSRDTRPALAEVSGNHCSKKRKASTSMVDTFAKKHKEAVTDDFVEEVAQRTGPGRPRKNQQYDRDEDKDVEQSGPRRPGRPAKNKELVTSREVTLGPSRRGSVSPSKGSRSPSKRGQLTVYKSISEAAIDMHYLSRCNPAVHLTKFHTLKKIQRRISPLVSDLFEKLQDIPSGSIPVALQDEYERDANTPRKSKEQYPSSQFLKHKETPFPPTYLSRMKSTADLILARAERAQEQDAHERQWGSIVSALLTEVEIWQGDLGEIIVLNVETCSIQPSEIRPKRPSPNDAFAIDCDTQTVTSDSNSKTSPESVGRMVDWCLALNIDANDMDVIKQAFAKTADYATSLNQTFSYIRNHPLILDIEIKKVLQPRDPQVQLAIWASSALLKKRMMGWDTSLPMPAVAVNGHRWDFYIFFEMDQNLMMAGPYYFGTTDTMNGIWTIFYRLDIIMKWGMTTFTDWIKKHVVNWAQQVIDEEG